MNVRAVFRVLGFISVILGVAVLIPAVFAFFEHGEDLVALLISALIPLVLGALSLLTTRGDAADLRLRDGFAVVTFAWIIASVYGMLPYWFTGVCGPVDALFEAMSGYTTTGATIFQDIEVLPRGILLWRSLTQWMGGMGIVLISVAVLPLLGVGGMQLFRAEVPGPTTDRLSPRIQSTAKALWGAYLTITALEVVFLMVGGMSLFESICHSFTTVSTGGFSTRNASVGAFHSSYIEWVITGFMFIAGVNFSLHLFLVQLRWKRYLANEEVRFYTLITLGAAAVLGLALHTFQAEGGAEASRHAAFQAVSILTTTGFGTADYLLWGFGSQFLLFLLMFLGGCAGSTAGGLKILRVIILGRYAAATARKEIHPRAIFNVRYSGKVVPDEVMLKILAFFLFYIFLFFVIALLVASLGVDLETSIGASIATLSNIGPGLGQVGPASTYALLPGLAKMILAFSMLLGRLELYTVLVVMSPMFWRRT